MVTLKRIGVFSLAKVLAVLYAALGLIIGLFFSLFGLAFGSMMNQYGNGGGMYGALFGVGAIIFMPIFYGIIGFVGGALTAWIYNMIAGAAGGIELEFENPAQPVQPQP